MVSDLFLFNKNDSPDLRSCSENEFVNRKLKYGKKRTNKIQEYFQSKTIIQSKIIK